MSEKFTQPDDAKVLRVECVVRDKIMGGHRQEYTQATVRTPVGDVYVRVPGYHGHRSCYPVLVKAALDKAWWRFCNLPDVVTTRIEIPLRSEKHCL